MAWFCGFCCYIEEKMFLRISGLMQYHETNDKKTEVQPFKVQIIIQYSTWNVVVVYFLSSWCYMCWVKNNEIRGKSWQFLVCSNILWSFINRISTIGKCVIYPFEFGFDVETCQREKSCDLALHIKNKARSVKFNEIWYL